MPTSFSDHPNGYTYNAEFLAGLSGIENENVTIASGAGIVLPGTILGMITASKKYVPLNLAASDGSQNAAGILRMRVDATSADAPGVAVVRLTQVVDTELIYPAGATTNQKATIASQLAISMLIIRTGLL